MTALDPYAYYDGAYALGALSAKERAAFEAHLRTCPECRARVEEVAWVPALLAGIPEEAFTAVEDAPPDRLLPTLLRAAPRADPTSDADCSHR